ncbi:hypothetical protein OHA02_14815 [Streptomyces phaeochromogenes]|nr:hypothetical protein [Streptomyces phaeochromogenes]
MIRLGPVRGGIAVARNCIGRLATLTSAAALTTCAFTPDLYGASLAAAIAATGWGALWSVTLPPGYIREASAPLYLAPSVSMAVLLTVERIVPGVQWWELTLDAVWAAAVWFIRPARLARVWAGREPSLNPDLLPAAKPVVVAAGSQHPMSLWWAQHVAVQGGAAPGTVLEGVEQTGPKSLRAVIRSTLPGQPVPEVSPHHLSALLDWPEEEISIRPVPRRGAGVRQLTVGHGATAVDLYSLWEEQIAPKGMPGTRITKVRTVSTGTELDG